MKWFILFLALTFAGPLWLLWRGQVDFDKNWQTANRESAHIAPDPKKNPEAIIQMYLARAFHWRGLFSVHTWLAVKKKDAAEYTVYQVVGWRSYYGLPVLSAEKDIPDRYWFNQEPQIIFDLRGEKAEKLIPEIENAIKDYPYKNYDVWPGPNSNTLPAYIARKVPELELILPSNAIGKDFLPAPAFFAKAPSNTGYQFSLFGILGIMLAKKEGIEINILSFVYGISPYQKAIKLPCVGDIVLW